MTPAAKTTVRPTRLDRILWIFVGGLGLLFLSAAVVRPDEAPLFFTSIGVPCFLLSIVGTIAKWGPLVPCMLLGAFLGTWFAVDMVIGPIRGPSLVADTVVSFGGLLMGAVGGAVLGAACERSRIAAVDAGKGVVRAEKPVKTDGQPHSLDEVPGVDTSGESSPPLE